MTAELNTILTDIHAVYTHEFNVVLLNLYRTEKTAMVGMLTMKKV